MMSSWALLLIGALFGACAGVLIVALMVMAKESDE